MAAKKSKQMKTGAIAQTVHVPFAIVTNATNFCSSARGAYKRFAIRIYYQEAAKPGVRVSRLD
jgi:hypothetical protein